VLVLWLLGCADIQPIEDGAVYGQVEVVKDWFTSAGLVQTDETTLLVDAGFRSGKMRRSLRKRGLTPEDVDHVVLTHGHGDHVGAISIYSNAKIWALPEEETNLSEESVEIDGDLVEGWMTLGDIDFEVIAAPGHTPGSAVFVFDGVALLGDTGLITKAGKLSPVAEKRSEDPEAAEQMLGNLAEALIEREVEWVVPSHSGAASFEVLQAHLED